MTETIRLNRVALEAFAESMEITATDMADAVDTVGPSYSRSGAIGAESASRSGVKMTLGAVNHAHSGRVAGELMADKIAQSLEFMISLEEGARALSHFTREVLAALNAQDEITAWRLNELAESLGVDEKLLQIAQDGWA
ncbi:hypothetical protein FB566_0853 [Stackebrandtia endophytica]|uniref:Excreted virulence factor EspC (Type VII ESX diderm) n=1 Tax=Stackebrandtia endophytica TaxID=1496996 RepID=A0A543AS71_9ACTN|nr:hypothetical protein [Stackebrandtia endophytica]TQL75355.1 hypothetical protein FB566_0853 [Stackebrandtia endophytica]